ncbi:MULTISPECIES: MFS transporter [unclassified Rhizobium]|uniref:MFS transporter n=1 Tax=unclassified Rhizobium TaxID=2613769 RepID=UPI000CDF31CC|nr:MULTISPECIES: MFS transporter [Rhizobium]AVA21203.1 ribonucleoside transporter protein [Rhizobium sp. NXC24]MDK4739328.1 MFS transporter [Rhizobium sp. CNPSo 3464]UWU22375.1 MFS transporter [Rhizobium tropici]
METTYDNQIESTASPWGIVICMTLMTFTLVASEFLPVSLLTPIADELSITVGQAGQAISVSGFFAVVTSLFSNALLARLDRRAVVLSYTGVLVLSGLAITFAPNYLVFMVGRALIGVSIGGFWSLSTAIMARIVSGPDLPKALAMLQGGSALASVVAQPLGSFLGGLIGWRGAFFIMVPIAIIAFIWQVFALPKIPGGGAGSVRGTFGLLRNRTFAIGMAAMTFFFMGQFALSTYLRPFLGDVTGLDVNGLSLVLLGIGLAGLLGTSLIGFLLRSHLSTVLVGFPAVLMLIAVLLIPLGPSALTIAALLALFGLFATPIPVAWGTWLTRIIPSELEAGGGLQVALIQFAITFGAFTGGMLFDSAGWWSPFAYSAILFMVSSVVAVGVTRLRPR